MSGLEVLTRAEGYLIPVAHGQRRSTGTRERIDSEVMAAYKEAVKFGDLAEGPYVLRHYLHRGLLGRPMALARTMGRNESTRGD